jgi:regulator of sirC expression with transglutaminase-like and TPR domain
MYAQNGLWYDAVAAVSELIESSPKDCALRRKRAFLLQQVGLPQIADYDLKTEGMPCPSVTPPTPSSR